MNITLILRITFGIAVIQYFVHALLFLRSKPRHGADEVAVINAMKSNRWSFNGFYRSYWDFYYGYGVLAILFGLVEIALLCMLMLTGEASLPLMKPIIGILFFANFIHTIVTLRYFFLMPLIFDLIISFLLALAWMQLF